MHCGSIGLVRNHNIKLIGSKFSRSYYPVRAGCGLSSLESSSSISDGGVGLTKTGNSVDGSQFYFSRLLPKFVSHSPTKLGSQAGLLTPSCYRGTPSVALLHRSHRPDLFQRSAMLPTCANRCMTTVGSPVDSAPHDFSATDSAIAPRIKFKRLDKTAGHIMQILDKEAVEEVRTQREIPDIKPGYIIQLKVEVPENKRRVSTIKGIVIARRNAGLNTTFRLRRLVAGVGVESLFPLYSPNIKEIKVLDKKKVRRAKLYYLRDKMNALKK